MGQSKLETTMIYLHLTRKGTEDACAIINQTMTGFRKTRQWLETQINRLLPGHHFLITFTVPELLRLFMRSHQRVAYAALFKSSAEAMKKLACDERHIGGELPGFFGVLHTWASLCPWRRSTTWVAFSDATN